jgi:hypothetical protein
VLLDTGVREKRRVESRGEGEGVMVEVRSSRDRIEFVGRSGGRGKL